MRLQPTRGLAWLDLRELWQYRELAAFLAWRDIKVRYKHTVLGLAWVLIQPLAMMLVFWLFFGRLAGLGEGVTVPYPLFALAGLPAWQFFARVVQESGGSLLTNQRLLAKVYFPRILAPVASAGAAFLDFTVCLGLLLAALAAGGYLPGWQALAVPAFVALMLATALGVGCWLAALSTEFRDVVHVIPFLVQFWLIATPVVYPASLIPERFRWLAGLNPMAGVVEGFRWALLGTGEGPGPMSALSAAVAVLLLLSGIAWFRWRERRFADLLGG